MTVNIFMSGPIRPTPDVVLDVVKTLKQKIPKCRTFLCTWKGQLTPTLKDHFDYSWEIPEPSVQFIQQKVTSRTRQQRELHPQLEEWTFNIYRMVEGVSRLCDLARPYCNDDDIVIRIRTDTFFLFEDGYLETLLSSVDDFYTVRNRKSSGAGFDDWFGIANYKIMRKAWEFNNYNESVQNAWNAEDLVYRNIKQQNISVRFMDYDKVKCFIRRSDTFDNYHP